MSGLFNTDIPELVKPLVKQGFFRPHENVTLLIGDVRDRLKQLPDNHFHCAVTSPPYFQLRSYLPDDDPNKAREIGQEATPEEYADTLVDVFHELKRVLRPDGVFWLNIDDSYNSSLRRIPGYALRELLCVPWLTALAMRKDGWVLRSEIIWVKRRVGPVAAVDRPRNTQEKVFMFSKTERHYWDDEAVRERGSQPAGTVKRGNPNSPRVHTKGTAHVNVDKPVIYDGTRSIRNVWEIEANYTTDQHFALMPVELAQRCILASTSEHGCCAKCGAPWQRQRTKKNTKVTNFRLFRRGLDLWEPTCECDAAVVPCRVLDPFGGMGTTGIAASQLGRQATLVELSASFVAGTAARLDRVNVPWNVDQPTKTRRALRLK